MTKYINVRTAPGRIAYDAPRGGRKIPTDSTMSVRETSYVRRLIDHHHDLIEEGSTSEPPVTPPATRTAPIPPVAPIPPTK